MKPSRSRSRAGWELVWCHAIACTDYKKEHGVSVVDVKGFPVPSAWHIVHPAGRKMSPLAMAFRQHLREESSQHKVYRVQAT